MCNVQFHKMHFTNHFDQIKTSIFLCDLSFYMCIFSTSKNTISMEFRRLCVLVVAIYLRHIWNRCWHFFSLYLFLFWLLFFLVAVVGVILRSNQSKLCVCVYPPSAIKLSWKPHEIYEKSRLHTWLMSTSEIH